MKNTASICSSWNVLPESTSNSTCSSSVLILAAISAFVQQSIKKRLAKNENFYQNNEYFLHNRVFDYVIIGGGSAGAVVANRLSEVNNNNNSVLLLEAGGEEPPEVDIPGYNAFLWGSEIDWQYKTEPQDGQCNNEGCRWPRGKCLGGSSSINSMMYVRGNPRDFDHWESLGNPGWGWKDVLPFFKLFEDNRDLDFSHDRQHHNTGGPQSVERFPYMDENAQILYDGFLELGLQPIRTGNNEHRESVALLQFFSRGGERWSTNRGYLVPARKRPNLVIATNSLATKIIIDEKNKQAIGVEFSRGITTLNNKVSPTKRTRVFAKREIIISAGAVNSPQLLLLSGIGPKEDLEKVGIPLVHELPGVGQNLQDHPTANIFDLSFTRTSSVPKEISGWTKARCEYSRKRNGPFASLNTLQTFAFVSSNYTSKDYPDIQITLGPSIDDATCISSISDVEKCSDSRRNLSCFKTSYPFSNGVTVAPTVLRPRSRGYITLRDNNPFHPPRIFTNYFSNETDMKILLQGFEVAKKLANTKTLLQDNHNILVKSSPIEGCENYVFASENYLECAIRRRTRTNYHASGTCKMGPATDKMAVVDSRLRVHGLKKLRVIDASVMPTIVSANTGATSIMIGEKGAASIKDDWNEF